MISYVVLPNKGAQAALFPWMVSVVEFDAAADRDHTPVNATIGVVALVRTQSEADLLKDALNNPLNEIDHISIVWTVNDITDAHPHLTDEQAADVLDEVQHRHDAAIGINWTVIDTIVSMKYPDPGEEEEEDEDGPEPACNV